MERRIKGGRHLGSDDADSFRSSSGEVFLVKY